MLRCEEPPVVAVAASPAFLSLSEPTGALTSWVPQFLWPHLLPISKTGSLPASPLPPPDLICHLPEAAALSSQMHKAEETGPEQEPPGDPAGGHPLPDRDRGPDRPGPSCRERVGLVGRPEVTTASQEKTNKAVSMEWGGGPSRGPWRGASATEGRRPTTSHVQTMLDSIIQAPHPACKITLHRGKTEALWGGCRAGIRA